MLQPACRHTFSHLAEIHCPPRFMVQAPQGRRDQHSWSALRKPQAEEDRAKRHETNLRNARNRYNTSRTAADVSKGDRVMIKRNQTKDSLSPKFDVLERRGQNAKLRQTRNNKWVYLGRVKWYGGPVPSLIQANNRQAVVLYATRREAT